MGMENAEFVWYAKKVTPWAASGYFAGIGAYLAQAKVCAHGLGVGALGQG